VIKSRRIIWARHVARTGGEERWGNLREKDRLEPPSVDGRINIKMDLQEVVCGGMDWIDLAQDRDT
jgi:hypothetical protein